MADIDIFEPREMIGVLAQMKAPSRWLLDTFFPTVRQHNTDKFDIDIVDKMGRAMAPFVSHRLKGAVMSHKGYYTNTYTPPYIKILSVTEAGEALVRQPGETIYNSVASPAQRAGKILGEDLRESRDQIDRRLEWMASQLLNSGTVVCQGEGIDLTVDFQMLASHKITNTGTELWDDAGSNPIKQLCDWTELVAQDSGIYPKDAVFGVKAQADFFSNPSVIQAMETRRIYQGELRPQYTAPGLKWLGRLTECNLDLWCYSESYYDPDTETFAPYVPETAVWVASRGAKTAQHYGLIKDLKAGNAAVQFFAKSWEEENPSVRYLLVQSAPLVAMHQKDAFLRATVTTPSA